MHLRDPSTNSPSASPMHSVIHGLRLVDQISKVVNEKECQILSYDANTADSEPWT